MSGPQCRSSSTTQALHCHLTAMSTNTTMSIDTLTFIRERFSLTDLQTDYATSLMASMFYGEND